MILDGLVFGTLLKIAARLFLVSFCEWSRLFLNLFALKFLCLLVAEVIVVLSSSDSSSALLWLCCISSSESGSESSFPGERTFFF